MSTRKESTDAYDSSDNDDRKPGVNLNRAIRQSYGDRISDIKTQKSIKKQSVSTANEQKLRSEYNLYTSSGERSPHMVRSTTIFLPLKDRTIRQSSQKSDRISEKNYQNKFPTRSKQTITDLKVEEFSQNTVINEITTTPVATSSKTYTHPDSSTNSNEGKTFVITPNYTIETLDESDIWPALTALEMTLNEPEANTSKNNREIVDKLSQYFNYSPRTFTETLLTIIEESFMQTEESSEELRNFMKKANAASTELLDDVSAPKFMSLPSSARFTDVSSSKIDSNVHISSSVDSTGYRSFKRSPSPAKSPRKSKIRANVGICSRETSPSRSSIGRKKINPRSPGYVINRKTPGHSGFRRSIGLEGALKFKTNAGICKKTTTPMIVVNPGTPTAPTRHRNNRQLRVEDPDNDAYLTADSDVDEWYDSADTIDEPAATSSEYLNMSRVAYHHDQWVQAYNKVSDNKNAVKKHTAKSGDRNEKISSHENKLAKRLVREWEQKRERCFHAINQILENPMDSDCPRKSEERMQLEFSITLRACSDYRAFVRSKVMSRKPLSGPSPKTSTLEKTVKKSTGSRFFNRQSKLRSTPAKRRSMKAAATPVIDKSSIRPVAELRMLFSPRFRVTDDEKVKAKQKKGILKSIVPSSRLGLRLTPKAGSSNVPERKFNRFGHVKSPVAEYIKGECTHGQS